MPRAPLRNNICSGSYPDRPWRLTSAPPSSGIGKLPMTGILDALSGPLSFPTCFRASCMLWDVLPITKGTEPAALASKSWLLPFSEPGASAAGCGTASDKLARTSRPLINSLIIQCGCPRGAVSKTKLDKFENSHSRYHKHQIELHLTGQDFKLDSASPDEKPWLGNFRNFRSRGDIGQRKPVVFLDRKTEWRRE